MIGSVSSAAFLTTFCAVYYSVSMYSEMDSFRGRLQDELADWKEVSDDTWQRLADLTTRSAPKKTNILKAFVRGKRSTGDGQCSEFFSEDNSTSK